eukprot:SAG11_NODE_11234_length_774_cov_2.250370_1_plen_145_part_00
MLVLQYCTAVVVQHYLICICYCSSTSYLQQYHVQATYSKILYPPRLRRRRGVVSAAFGQGHLRQMRRSNWYSSNRDMPAAERTPLNDSRDDWDQVDQVAIGVVIACGRQPKHSQAVRVRHPTSVCKRDHYSLCITPRATRSNTS